MHTSIKMHNVVGFDWKTRIFYEQFSIILWLIRRYFIAVFIFIIIHPLTQRTTASKLPLCGCVWRKSRSVFLIKLTHLSREFVCDSFLRIIEWAHSPNLKFVHLNYILDIQTDTHFSFLHANIVYAWYEMNCLFSSISTIHGLANKKIAQKLSTMKLTFITLKLQKWFTKKNNRTNRQRPIICDWNYQKSINVFYVNVFFGQKLYLWLYVMKKKLLEGRKILWEKLKLFSLSCVRHMPENYF
jgi:hypothetical protein